MFNLQALLSAGPVFFDGGTGTVLQAMGLAPGARCEAWNLTRPSDIIAHHRAYLAAGAQILKTNTFGANRLHFGDGLREVAAAGVRCAKEAVALEGTAAYIAKAPMAFVALDIGPLGKLVDFDLAFEEAIALFRETIEAGAGEADLILIETMGDTQEVRAAIIAAKEAAPGLPILCTLTFEASGRLLSGATPQAAAAILEGMGVQAVGINCGAGPERARQILPQLLEQTRLPVIVNPNAGLPRMEGARAVYDLSPENFALQCEELFQMGASVLGGCCGTAPAHIAALTALLKGKKINPPQNKKPPKGEKPPLEAWEDCIAGPREVLPLSQADPDDLEEYDPEEPSFEPIKITGDDPAALEALLRGYNGRALVAAPAWAAPLVEKYGGILAR